MGDLTKSVKESLNDVDPLLKYPSLLALAETINEMLPSAEEEFNQAREDILLRFLEIVRER